MHLAEIRPIARVNGEINKRRRMIKARGVSTPFQRHAKTNLARGLLVLDLDHTVLRRPRALYNGMNLYVGHEDDTGLRTGEILPGCLNALASARSNWNLVAVTARWGVPRCRTNTEIWLNAHDLSMPTYFAHRPIPTDGPRAAFKAQVISRLLNGRSQDDATASGRAAPAVGIGDRPSDMEAYVRNGLTAVMITDSLGELGAKHAELLEQMAHKLRSEYGDGGKDGAHIHFFASDQERLAWDKIGSFLDEIIVQQCEPDDNDNVEVETL